MAGFEISTDIDWPVEEVWTYLDNIENAQMWQAGVLESHLTSESPMGVGATWRDVRKFLGKQIDGVYECTEYEPNKRFAFKSSSGPIPVEGISTFEAVGGGTRFNFAFEARPGGFFKFAEPIAIRMAKRQFEADFSNLKDLLESQA